MIFNSSLFLLYFLPVLLIVYYLLDRRFKNMFLLVASVLFYAWGAPKFVFFVMASVTVDYYLVGMIPGAGGWKRKTLFWASVLLNLALLLYFKYMNFFVDQFDVILGWLGSKPAGWTKIALPVGISFITFQKLSYTLDVYKRKHPALERFWDYALYIFMFPQILAGPIVRVGQIAGQIRDRSSQETVDDKLTGLVRFMIGLAKKVLIADLLGVTVNEIFALPSSELSTGLAWAGAIAYTFQIYYDFSGYSDMAIGLARMLGFRLPENFNFPYLSNSITEFWKRWHMTLSAWLRDYLFLPIAYSASRKLPNKRYFGIQTDKILYLLAASVTFVLCGFWHGAAWTFILWGAYQGLFLILERFFLLRFYKWTGRVPAILITFLVIVLGWVVFRSENLDFAHYYLRRMFMFVSRPNDIWLNPKFWTMLAIATFFSFWGSMKRIGEWIDSLFDKPGNAQLVSMSVVSLILLVLSLSAITSNGFNPFIYFRF
jgi:alginate O-acetyltransferase complex protein AlgI